MHWTEPATSEDSHAELEKKLWDAANQLWAGADLKPSEYSPTVLGLIFLRYADMKFAAVEADLKPQAGSRRKIGPADYHAAGVIYLPETARFSHLLQLPEGGAVGQEINSAMRAIEQENPDLSDVLPKNYQILDSKTLASLLKTMASIDLGRSGGLRPSNAEGKPAPPAICLNVSMSWLGTACTFGRASSVATKHFAKPGITCSQNS